MTNTVSAEELAAVKSYMRVDGNADDALISAMYLAAKQYIVSGVCPEPEDPSQDPQWVLMVQGLTLNYYDHREAFLAGSAVPVPLGLRAVMTQRKLCGNDAAVYSQGDMASAT